MSPAREIPPPVVPRTVEDYRGMWPRTAMEAHGIELLEIDEHHAVLRMPVTDAERQPMGWLHGGMTLMLIETAASVHACWGVNLAERVPVGVEIGAAHVLASADGPVQAVATVIRRSASHIFHAVEVRHAGTGQLLSSGRATNYYRRPSGGSDLGG